MSMHLCSPALTTTATRKRKKKLTDNQHQKMIQDCREYNKQMRQCGLKEKTIEEYIAYRQGNSRYRSKKMIKGPFDATTLRRESPKVESGAGIGVDVIGSRKENVYTGERKLLGIAVMHKSNLVPVFDQKDAEDIAKMRRN